MTWMVLMKNSPRSRWMLGTKELRKKTKITTARTETHFTNRTLSVILCCGSSNGKKEWSLEFENKCFYRRSDCICLAQLHYWDIINMHSKEWWVKSLYEGKMKAYLLLQLLNVLLPIFILLRNLSDTQTHRHMHSMVTSIEKNGQINFALRGKKRRRQLIDTVSTEQETRKIQRFWG